MDYLALLMPVLLIVGLFVGLVLMKRRLFAEPVAPAPIPLPEAVPRAAAVGAPPRQPAATRDPPVASASPVVSAPPSLNLARLYPEPLLDAPRKRIFSRLLEALPGYVVLPAVAYDQFLKAADGSPSENTSLQKRAAQQLADFVICDRALQVLAVCQVEDGSQLPARSAERERMLHKAGLRLLRWTPAQPPEAATLLRTVRTLERLARAHRE